MVNLENVIDKTGLLVLPRQQFLTKGDSQLVRNYSLPVLVVEKIIAQTVMNNGVSCDCSCTPSSGGPGFDCNNPAGGPKCDTECHETGC